MTERAGDEVTGDEHKPLPRQTQGRWQVHCSCGWKGPVVAMVGHGYKPWVEHFHEYVGPMSLEGMKR